MENPVIVVGCGGSGLATISSLNRMLASNPNTRYDLHNKVFYLVVDTEAAALSNFSKQIDKQMMGAEAPYVEKIHLSKNINILKEIISKYFEKPFKNNPEDPALERIRENWWYSEQGEPFYAPLVPDLKLGAGQCPPASFGLAWRHLREIERAVADIVEQIISRGNGDPSILANISLFVVAGLAGGTGRGTWNLISFKIRQYLEQKYNKPISPYGVFYGANVYPNVIKTATDNGLALKVNTLTGLSELSCWLKTSLSGHGNDTLLYRLPDMEAPGRKSSDVLATTLEICPTASAPVASSILICGSSAGAILTQNSQFHEMTGSALYSLILDDKVRADIINNNLSNPYNSMAAASCEIDTLHLQAYFESIACGVALERLAKNDDDVSWRVDEFFKNVPVDIAVRGEADLMPSRGGKLMQRAAYALLERHADALQSLRDELPTIRTNQKDAAEQAWDQVLGILDGMKESDVMAAVSAALAKKNAPDERIDVLAEIESAMLRAYKGDQKRNEKPSLGRAKKFLSAVLSRLNAAEGLCVGSIMLDGEDGDKGSARSVTEAKIFSLAGKNPWEILRGGPNFNESEVDELIKINNGIANGIIPTCIIADAYPKLIEALKAELLASRQRINELVNAFGEFEKLCGETRALMDQEAPYNAGGHAGDDAFDLLFVRPDEVDIALPDPRDPERYYKRILKPVYKDRFEIERLVADNLTIDDGVEKFLRKAIASGNNGKQGALLSLIGDDGVNIDLERQFQNELIETIRGNVRLADDFMVSKFSLMTVLENNRGYWNTRLKELSGVAVKRAKFVAKLSSFLGAVPVKVPNSRDEELPPAESLIRTLAVSLARTTQPYWLIENTNARLDVKVFLPVTKESMKTAKDLESEIRDAGLNYATIDPVFLSEMGTGASPYTLTTFVIESLTQSDTEIGNGRRLLDKINSFSYWSEPAVEQMLLKAETKTGDSIFDQSNGNKGIGFVSPIYVRNEKLRSFRWRPWFKSDDSSELDAASDAILYGFFGNCLNAKDGERIREILDEGGFKAWTTPLIKEGSHQAFTITRKTCTMDEEDGFIANPDCPWKLGKKLCVSICNLYPFIQGKGKIGRNGHATEKDVEEGKLVRQCILNELEVFEEEIRPSLGDLYKKLVKGRLQFLTEMRDKAKDGGDESDLAVWETLLARAKKLK